MVVNQNAQAFGLRSTVARMKMKTKPKSLVVAMTKMIPDSGTKKRSILRQRFDALPRTNTNGTVAIPLLSA